MNFNGINRRAFLKWLALVHIFFLTLDNRKTWGQKISADHSNDPQNTEFLSSSYVLRVHSPKVISNNNFIPDNYLDSIRGDVLDDMVAEGIKEFTKERDLRKAWLDILMNYKRGDKIAIKPNFNFLNHGYKFTITSPQLVHSVIKQLIEIVGVNPQEIFLYDLCKKIPEDIVINRISYPINYVERMDSKTIVDKVKLRLYYGLSSADLDAEIKMREDVVGKKIWKTFDNDFPKSIFMSKDPVAIDSVMASMVIRERNIHQLNILSTEYLNEAMNNGLGVCEINQENSPFKNIKYSTLIL